LEKKVVYCSLNFLDVILEKKKLS